jgi:hypothetical protein
MPASSLAPASLRAGSVAVIGANTTTAANSRVYGDFYNGRINEIIVYNQTLSENNRKLVENYLANKWSAEMVSTTEFNHPFRTSIPQQRPINPLDITTARVIFWIDAADPARFTVTNSNVTAITDKANPPSALTIGGTVGYDTTTLNGLPSFNLSNGRIIADTLASPIYPMYGGTVIFVGYLFNNPLSGRAAIATATNNTSTNGTRWRISEYNSAGTTRNVWSNNTTGPNVTSFSNVFTPALATGTPHIWAASVGTTGGGTTTQVQTFWGYLNDGSGNNYREVSSATRAIVEQRHLRVGGDLSIGLTSNTYPGCISEVIVFEGVLALTELRLISGYLAQKWNLSGYPQFSYYKAQNGGNSSANLDPTSIGNSTLKTWLDATDIYATALTGLSNPASGTIINTWMDKCDVSGNAGFRRRSAALNTQYLVDGNYPAVYFAGDSVLTTQYVNHFPSPNFTVAIVARNATFPIAGEQMPIIGWRDSNLATTFSWSIRTSSGGSNGTMLLQYGSMTSSTVRGNADKNILMLGGDDGPPIFRINGTDVNSNTLSQGTSNFDNGRIYIGMHRDDDSGRDRSFFTGYVYEVLMYTSHLSVTDRQRVEGYLAWKWGAQDKLPATHPFKRFAP